MRHKEEEDVSVEWRKKMKGREGRGCMEMEKDGIMAPYFYMKDEIDIHGKYSAEKAWGKESESQNCVYNSSNVYSDSKNNDENVVK